MSNPNPSDTTSITLPCGKSAVVSSFDGECQDIASNEAHLKSGAWFDLILRRVTRELDGKPAHQLGDNHLQNLRSGSRLRMMLESRRLSYGDDVTLEWSCTCGGSNSESFDLSTVQDVPYPAFDSQECEVHGKRLTIVWGTGVLESKFQKDRKKNLWGIIHEPLARIAAVDGEALGPVAMKKFPAGVLDAFMRAVRATNPRVLLGGVVETDDINPYGLKRGGITSRVQVACGSCGKTGTKDLEAAPDFLHRSMVSLGD